MDHYSLAKGHDAPEDPQAQPISPLQIIRSGLCIGCGTCTVRGRQAGARMAFDHYGQYKPIGPAEWLHQPSAHFARVCPFSPAALDEDTLTAELFPNIEQHHSAAGRSRAAYVGYVEEADFRSRGSSGGMASWVLYELMRAGLVDGVAHVAPADLQRDGCFFQYRIAATKEELRSGAKSRYYPIELSGVLETMRTVPGRYAVVGLPCFVKAVQLLRREDPVLRERIAFTLGLFCGHLKSARFLESIAWQMGVAIAKVQRADFRVKDSSRPASTYTAELELYDGRVIRRDWWKMADGDWGKGFFQNSTCNFCDDVVAETADISFGDAWVEPYASDGGGTNVVIVRSPVLNSLVTDAIAAGRLHLQPVDGAFVGQTQAAGLRQRREGLAYRLTWRQGGVMPRKRVIPDAHTLTIQRKLIYRMRSAISIWSHRVFWLSRSIHLPGTYVLWARAAVTLYHGPAYVRRRLEQLMDRIGLR